MLAEEDRLVVRAATQNALYPIGQGVPRSDAMLSWQAFDSKQTVSLNDYSTWAHRKEIYKDFSLHAAAAFPILNNEQCIGVLGVARTVSNYEFTSEQIQLGSLFAGLAALIIANAQLRERLKEQSIRDALTGLFNRRYMEEMLKREVSRATRRLHPLGIMMIDIDYFKRFNDTYGHAAGDKLLREVGKFLQTHLRGEDIACRYGGEEFILILPDVDLESLHERAQEICNEAQKIKIEDLPSITLSVGIAAYPQHGNKINAVIEAADNALYQAKQKGRNRVEVAK
jgi:diguanylate cyclase (GGDEF)-like protein